MKTFTAEIKNWSDKALRNIDLVTKQATQDTLEQMSERQPSIKETGTFEIGKVPVDTGALINSQIASINGAVVASGPVEYSAVILGMELGDTVEAVFTAEYARAIEYGTSKFPGRFFVRSAVQGWQGNVNAAAARFKD